MFLAAIQGEIRRGIDSIRSLMTPVEDPAIVFASAQLILLYLGNLFQTCSIGERSIGHGKVISLKTLWRVAHLDEHYPVDKWHLGDLIAWVAQSALKYRPRICELSKCLEDH
ncbi:hypothetical protein TNCV_2434421 [Trichonephila clavipes]|nr:hypothetical protein TNCV_2434421 [Trichonephila clavipes]